MDIVKLSDLNQILSFLETSSNEFASYIYKLPTNQDDLTNLLQHSLTSPGIFSLIENDEICALITAIEYEKNKFKVVGPFVNADVSFSKNDYHLLFNALRDSQDSEAVFNFSYDECVQTSKPLMKDIEASYNFTDYYLNVASPIQQSEDFQNIIEYQPGFQRAFTKLHQQTFKHSVLSSQEIINSLDDNNHLFLFVSEGLLKGYLYLQVSPQTSVAEIRYFSSHSDYRLMGIAVDLLSFAIDYAFNHYELEKVYFKIRSKNATLVERFNELGFKIDTEYKKYKYLSPNNY
ncbi:GNAT family N-acetyltransferase [Staphylococcus sp. NRL 16/872]|uniref:GNAT family N-acetyltransferase n=1 Tax=Staphylococcus sp. NRL 16/872 TaxID=2930131 RepID=UPI001FB22E7E|nr:MULTISPECIES: GNAT family N-acetyltransferase [unclassified Staphylococcus]MCJ1655795.1 GNAT family N-acetyltransferase [Staphylococcus sp. NRL 21/187]MCJ1661609.1 GNAT family N-acetyltransferase [Staphylococcus sp. NRL 18/288]MCJ1667530.1 GNAT family N-acetyltransferase [Staphylococcus sp. NRL 19/737]WEN70015.1 GNAT family N-acetyltransferase [Staphylococcus sp. NRL 16/872]